MARGMEEKQSESLTFPLPLLVHPNFLLQEPDGIRYDFTFFSSPFNEAHYLYRFSILSSSMDQKLVRKLSHATSSTPLPFVLPFPNLTHRM